MYWFDVHKWTRLNKVKLISNNDFNFFMFNIPANNTWSSNYVYCRRLDKKVSALLYLKFAQKSNPPNFFLFTNEVDFHLVLGIWHSVAVLKSRDQLLGSAQNSIRCNVWRKNEEIKFNGIVLHLWIPKTTNQPRSAPTAVWQLYLNQSLSRRILFLQTRCWHSERAVTEATSSGQFRRRCSGQGQHFALSVANSLSILSVTSCLIILKSICQSLIPRPKAEAYVEIS